MAPPRKKPSKKVSKPARKPKTGGGEKGLQYRCQQWLEKSGLWNRLLIFHVPNERKGSIGAVVHFKRMGVLPGVADYLAFSPSNTGPRPAYAIELKDEGEDPRPDQEQFQTRWEACGNYYFVVRTEDEFRATVTALTIFAG